MATKKVLNPLTDIPQSKSDITKDFMITYLESAKATQADKKWFKDLYKNNLVKKVNQLTKKETVVPNYTIIKREFVNRFFPQLNRVKSSKDFAERIENL